MYLEPAARGSGLGRALAEAAIAAARRSGYRRLLLDTVSRLATAIAIYEALGFVEIDAYRHNPMADARYFALDLTRRSARSAGRVGDEHGAGGAVGDGVRHAAEHPTGAVHALVAHHDEVGAHLVGHHQDRVGRVAGDGMDLHRDRRVAWIDARKASASLRDALSRAVPPC